MGVEDSRARGPGTRGDGGAPEDTAVRPGMGRYLLASGALLMLALVAVHQQWTWRFDQVLFDAHLALWARPPSPDIVIVAIDEESVTAIGRWPWSRRVHAAIVEQLTQAGARAIALDLIFAEPDRADPGADAALAAALARSARTVLPLVPEERHLGGPLVETRPIPELAAAAAALGHVDVELDRDAVARRVFLAGGLGWPRWPALALAMLAVAAPDRWSARVAPATLPTTSERWHRDREFLVPFAGPPGHFPRVSAVEVLDGAFAPEQFRNRLVLIGATVAGLGDALPTPVSGHHQPMPGVEFHANVIDALRLRIAISTPGAPLQMAITAAVLLLALALYPRLSPRRGLLCAVVLVVASIGASTALLYSAGLWFRPSVLCLALLVSYPLWSWLRLEYAVAYLEQEIHRLDAERLALSIPDRGALGPALEFVSRLLGIEGWEASDVVPRGETGAAPRTDRLVVEQGGRIRQLGPRLPGDTAPDRDTFAYLHDALGAFAPPADTQGPRMTEPVQARIAQVQSATERLRLLRELVGESIAQMGNGVLVADPTGRVLLTNRRAAHALRGDADAPLAGAALLDLLEEMPVDSGPGWAEALRAALVERTDVELGVRGRAGEDLLVHVGPLTDASGRLQGLVVALADITVLRDSERARAEILAFLSHDLRAPLVSVLALVELAQRGKREDDLHESLVRVGEYAARTLDLADQFLELSRANDPSVLERTLVDLDAVAAEALDDVWDQADGRGIRLESRLDLEDARIEADASAIRRAIVNLLGNAVEYSPAGSTVRLELERTSGGLGVCVSDEGPGIPPEELPHLFERFRRGSRERGAGGRGTGLGLAVVKTVAERHGGTVSAQSEPGRGSRFCMVLPARRGG